MEQGSCLQRVEIDPVFTTDPASGQGDNDFLECTHLKDARLRGSEDTWRVSQDGKATLIRGYLEDGEYLKKSLDRQPGTWFSPNWMLRSPAEFVRHARGMAERFDMPTTVSFRCEWHGLGGRHLDDPEATWSDHRAASGGDHRIVSCTWPVGTLSNGWAEIVAKLIAPVMRMVAKDFVITPAWVIQEARKWRR